MSAATKEEVWEMFREVARRAEETDRKIKEVTTAIGQLGNRLGQFVEEMVRPAVVRLFQERGIAVHEVYRRASSCRDGESMEVDLLVVNNTDAIAIEVKSDLSVADVDEHLERLSRFKKMFPHYCNLQIFGAIAAMVLPDDVARYAYRQGLFVLSQSGNTVIIRNDTAFVPRGW